jgi:hypothetical protein
MEDKVFHDCINDEEKHSATCQVRLAFIHLCCMEGASKEVIAEHVLALQNRISLQALVPPPPPPRALPRVQGNYTGPGPSTKTPWARNNESPVQQSTTHQSPDSLDGRDVWEDT